MLFRLGMEAYISPLGTRDVLPGRNPTTHRASVVIDNVERDCVVKIPHPEDAGFSLVNESLCYMLASEMNLLPTNTKAAVLDMPLGALPENLRSQGWLAHYAVAPAWCLTWCPCVDLRTKDARELVALMGRSKLGAGILAFDEWIANGDRHGENLLRCEGGRLVPIDHEEAFGGVQTRLFGIPGDSHGLLSKYGAFIDQDLVRKIANRAMVAHGRCKPALEKVMENLPGWLRDIQACHDHIDNVLRFLHDRATKDWFTGRIGLMI